MNNEQADDVLRSAIQQTTGRLIIGNFVVVATVYDDDGEARTAVQAPEGMTLPDQIGLLTSALNRANAVDSQGWERAAERDEDE